MASENESSDYTLEHPDNEADTGTIPAISSADELQALTSVVEALQRISDNDVRHRVLTAAAAFFRVQLTLEAPPQSPRGRLFLRGGHKPLHRFQKTEQSLQKSSC